MFHHYSFFCSILINVLLSVNRFHKCRDSIDYQITLKYLDNNTSLNTSIYIHK